MKKIFLLTLLIALTSIVGFSSGYIITRTIDIHNRSLVIAGDSPKNPLPEIKEEVKVEPKIMEVAETPKKDDKTVKKPTTNPCQKPKKDFADETYLDVGQDVSLDDASYIPSDLVPLDKSISKSFICVKSDAAKALEAMFRAAKTDGYNIIVSSGFRDYATQKSIVDRETKNGNKNVSVAVAKPGYSEHQLGVAVDLTSASIAFASAAAKFGDTLDAKWLEIHAREYGFIQSYPKGKEAITGYMYEPWHYRYVGIDNAKEIIKNNQTINEFLKAKKDAVKNTP